MNINAQTPKGTLSTKLKFVHSDVRPGTMIAFVKEAHGRIEGVRENDNCAKKICLAAPEITPYIQAGVLYDAIVEHIIRDKHDFYKATSVKPYKFHATLEVIYVPKAVYQIMIRFGNAAIKFDPKDGKQPSVRNKEKCKDVIAARYDLKDTRRVLKQFEEKASQLIRQYEADGYIYNPKA